jgi:hypothetical protein
MIPTTSVFDAHSLEPETGSVVLPAHCAVFSRMQAETQHIFIVPDGPFIVHEWVGMAGFIILTLFDYGRCFGTVRRLR